MLAQLAAGSFMELGSLRTPARAAGVARLAWSAAAVNTAFIAGCMTGRVSERLSMRSATIKTPQHNPENGKR